MPSRVENLSDELPTSINPYKVLEIEKTATADEIKTAYRKSALKHHPDKATEEDKEEAKDRFQKISFAYGVLSDPRRRSRYDTTGRTEESLHLDDEDDFNWSDFFRAQFEEVVSADAIEKFKKEYQNSEEEKLDVIGSYVNNEGDMDAVFEEVMLSNPIDDEQRFRAMIDEEIEEKRVEAFDAYTKESKKKRKQRLNNAKSEADEAMKAAEELGVKDKLFGNGEPDKNSKKSKNAGEKDYSALTSIIQQRQKSREATFLADLEAKYATKKGSKGKKRPSLDEPSEEAFERNRKIRTNVDEENEVRPRAKRSRRS